MTKIKQIYSCSICGNIVEVLHSGVGQLVCCGQVMELLGEKKEDVGQEKHVPIIETVGNNVKVKVGSVPHPMEQKHYIELVEIMTNGEIYRRFLKPSEKPEAEFCVTAEKMQARAYCNIHGLWKSK